MKRKYPDGPKINLPMAIVGQLLPRFFPFDALEFNVGIARKFGDIAHYRVGPLHVYQLNHPDLARQILVEQAHKFYKPKLMKRAFRPFAGEGLLTNDGAFWKQQRKLIQPAFHQRHLAIYGGAMVDEALKMCDAVFDGETRDIDAEMGKLTLAVVVKSLFGSELPRDAGDIGNSVLAVIDAATQRVNAPLNTPRWVPTRRNLRERRAISLLDTILSTLIRKRRASTGSHDDLLALLLAAVDEETGTGMSDRQLRDEMLTLFLAGQETTANALTWTWYLLARHPGVEARLLNEFHRVLGGRPPSWADLPNMPYTEMVVREAMRLYPPGPAFAREPVEDVIIGGYNVPRGSLILVNAYALHHDERFFGNPERFDPERFAKGWEERTPRYAYLPFGGGPRVCIGNGFAMMEARLVLAAVAQNWKLSLTSPEEIAPVQMVTLRPKCPVRMRLEKRTA